VAAYWQQCGSVSRKHSAEWFRHWPYSWLTGRPVGRLYGQSYDWHCPMNGTRPVSGIEKKRSVGRSGAQSAEWSIRLIGRNIYTVKIKPNIVLRGNGKWGKKPYPIPTFCAPLIRTYYLFNTLSLQIERWSRSTCVWVVGPTIKKLL
jgi:hypothetical protein